ncbi:unnamed protein product [Pleuronectes platessa]|uniref:Uncharacterized protein n=1 Tax=Pleuronectes platessa TaxID=8262 RepID=A0A9N7VRL1_PLEPL|nr:unnamed protein product [Pleuronectes platessa]
MEKNAREDSYAPRLGERETRPRSLLGERGVGGAVRSERAGGEQTELRGVAGRRAAGCCVAGVLLTGGYLRREGGGSAAGLQPPCAETDAADVTAARGAGRAAGEAFTELCEKGAS